MFAVLIAWKEPDFVPTKAVLKNNRPTIRGENGVDDTALANKNAATLHLERSNSLLTDGMKEVTTTSNAKAKWKAWRQRNKSKRQTSGITHGTRGHGTQPRSNKKTDLRSSTRDQSSISTSGPLGKKHHNPTHDRLPERLCPREFNGTCVTQQQKDELQRAQPESSQLERTLLLQTEFNRYLHMCKGSNDGIDDRNFGSPGEISEISPYYVSGNIAGTRSPPPAKGQFGRQFYLCLRCRLTGHIKSDCPYRDIPKPGGLDWAAICVPTQQQSPEPLEHWRSNRFEHWMCNRCKKIPILRFFTDYWATSWNTAEKDRSFPLHSLGLSSSIIFRNDCSLCRLLFRMTADPVDETRELLIVPSFTMHRIEPKMACGQWQPKSAICLYTALKPKERPSNYIQDRLALCYQSLGSLALVGKVVEDKIMSSVMVTMSARKVDPRHVNFTVLRGWLERCIMLHPSTCRPESSHELENIWLIDVIMRKLVRYPKEQECEYLTLSYVWGRVSQPSYPLGSILGRCAATIEDAMVVVRRLGKRYLWVDSLCINQTNSSHKMAQITHMSTIYRGAWATIIALSGKCAESGLARANPGSKIFPEIVFAQDVCLIEGKELVSCMPTLAQQVTWSPWTKRAWTLQEGLLSPRCLYFTQHQVYFECNATQCCEALDDTNSPHHNLTETAMAALESYRLEEELGSGVLRNPFVGPQFNPDSDNHTGRQFRLESYGRLIKTYSSRAMTHDSDAVNAISGILQYLDQKCYSDKGFFFGLPLEHLPYALLWEHSTTARRRLQFPSWSWAGWAGPLSEAYPELMLIEESFQPFVRIWTWKPSDRETDGSLVQIFKNASEVDPEHRADLFSNDAVRSLLDKPTTGPSFSPRFYADTRLFIEGITLSFAVPLPAPPSTQSQDHFEQQAKYGWLELLLSGAGMFVALPHPPSGYDAGMRTCGPGATLPNSSARLVYGQVSDVLTDAGFCIGWE